MSRRKKSRLLERVEYAAYRAVAALAARASDASVARWGARIGTLARRVLRKRDRLALGNMQAAFPDRAPAELRGLLDDCWRHFGRELLLYIRLQRMPLHEIARLCPFDGAELLEEARARGNGVVLISAHWGGWEVGGLALMALVDNVRTVARPLDNALLEQDLVAQRAKTGAEVVDRRAAARVLLRGLRDNAVIVLLPDQAVLPREGVLVPFLGRDAWTTAAPAKMALHHGSTIVFAFCIPDGDRHRLEFEEPIRVDQLSEEERDPVALTKRINDVLARRIATRPELWLWMHDRWKGTATG
jgi:KDO2-lipid IV(A) lauroyltransferase